MSLFLENLWFVYSESAPYLLLGFVIAGILHQYMPNSFIQRHLSGRGFIPIVKAAIIGTPVPLCSCGVVPVGLSLHEKGLGRGPTSSFLISTPENGVDSISLSYSLFGGLFTGVRIFFSMVVAVITGTMVQWFGTTPESQVPQKSCCGSKTSTEPSAKPSSRPNGFRYIMHQFLPKTVQWLLIGFCLSAVIASLVPKEFFTDIDPNSHKFLAAVIGIPLYVCAAASTPIALSLYLTGMSPGACLVFLLTGPATNASNIPLYAKQLGSRTTAIFYISIFVTSIACGFVVDSLFTSGDFLVSQQMGHEHEEASLLGQASTAVFSVALAYAAYRRYLWKA